jgi:hypothetical protein
MATNPRPGRKPKNRADLVQKHLRH